MKIGKEVINLSWYQIIGGLVGIGILIKFSFQRDAFTGFNVLALLAMLLLYLLSVASGFILLKNPLKGILLSKISQFFQIVGFAIGGFSFQYISRIKLSIGLDLTENVLLNFNASLSSFQYNWSSNNEDAFITLNIVPIVVIHLLTKVENKLTLE